jgi:hypothetical protein
MQLAETGGSAFFRRAAFTKFTIALNCERTGS